MKLVFLDSSMVYDGNTPEHEPLGGSQSALVYITKELAAKGCDVKVYNQCPAPGDYDGVEYRRWLDLWIEGPYDNADVVISLRDPAPGQFFWQWGGKKILWNQDWYDQPCLSGLNGETDHVFFVGHAQRAAFNKLMHWPEERSWVVPNGINHEFFRSDDHTFREGKRLVYTSTPFRGLEQLLHLYPRIRARVSEAELHIYGGMECYQDPNHEANKLYTGFLDMDGVVLHRAIGQRKLAEEIQKARVFAYPNTFPESCCISAYEAMAGGTVVVTSEYAGLEETVGPQGIMVRGVPGTPEYDDVFVDMCVEYLTNDAQWGLLARKSWAWTLTHRTYRVLADTWIQNLELILRG